MLSTQAACLIAAKLLTIIWIPYHVFIDSGKALRVGQRKMLKF